MVCGFNTWSSSSIDSLIKFSRNFRRKLLLSILGRRNRFWWAERCIPRRIDTSNCTCPWVWTRRLWIANQHFDFGLEFNDLLIVPFTFWLQEFSSRWLHKLHLLHQNWICGLDRCFKLSLCIIFGVKGHSSSNSLKQFLLLIIRLLL